MAEYFEITESLELYGPLSTKLLVYFHRCDLPWIERTGDDTGGDKPSMGPG